MVVVKSCRKNITPCTSCVAAFRYRIDALKALAHSHLGCLRGYHYLDMSLYETKVRHWPVTRQTAG